MTWKKKRPDAVPGIDGISKQRPIFQLDRHLAQGNDELFANDIRAEILGTDLYDTGPLALSRGQDRAEVEIIRENHIVVCASIGHDLRIWRIVRPQGGPMGRLDACVGKHPYPPR